MYVRRYPDLWLWMHRRWRDVPEGEQVRGMFPAATADAPEPATTEPHQTCLVVAMIRRTVPAAGTPRR